MNKLSLLTIVCLLAFCCPGISQDYPQAFNALTDEEWEITSYEKDPNADAIVLFDTGKSQFIESNPGYDIKFTRHKRIKILKSSGIRHAEIRIPFYFENINSTESVNNLRAYTYNIVDGIVRGKKVDRTAIFEEQVNQNWKIMKFTFPNVQEGSIIEFKYELLSPFKFNLPDWEFQSDIPTLYSEYIVRTIPFYEYVYITKGFSKFDSTFSELSEKKLDFNVANVADLSMKKTHYQEIVNAYVMKDVPAFKDETFITSKNDYQQKMDFQLAKFHSPYSGSREIITTWPKMVKSFLEIEDFGKYLRNSESQAKRILKSELILSGEKPLKDIASIVDYVKKNFSWNDKVRKYATKSAKDFVSQKTGNMAEVNLFLCGMLKAAGYEATPILLSTRNHGKIPKNYPFTNFFNAVVVMVTQNGRTFLTDATNPLIKFDRIPPYCINDYGLIIDKEKEGWVDLSNKYQSVSNNSFMVSVDTTKMEANILLSKVTTEMESYYLKNLYGDDPKNFEEYLTDQGFSDVGNVKIRNFERPDKPFFFAAQVNSELEVIGERIVISPFFNLSIKENPLQQDDRTYPIDLIYAKTENFTSRITIPKGYVASELPENIKVDDELVTISISYSQVDNQISVQGTYAFKKAVYEAKNYQQLKDHFETIVSRFNKQIVLKKT